MRHLCLLFNQNLITAADKTRSKHNITLFDKHNQPNCQLIINLEKNNWLSVECIKKKNKKKKKKGRNFHLLAGGGRTRRGRSRTRERQRQPRGRSRTTTTTTG